MPSLRLMFIGQTSSGKTSMMRNFIQSGDQFVRTFHPNGEAITTSIETLRGTLELTEQRGTVPVHNEDVEVEFLDTVGGHWANATYSKDDELGKILQEYHEKIKKLHALVVAIEPHAVYGLNDKERLALVVTLGHACVALRKAKKERSLSIAIVYTMADEYGIPYDAMGRVLQTTEDARRLVPYHGGRNGVGEERLPLLDALQPALERQFGKGLHLAKAKDVIGRTSRLWDAVFSFGSIPGQHANAYFCASLPMVEGSAQRNQMKSGFDGSAGAIPVFDDILSRVLNDHTWKYE